MLAEFEVITFYTRKERAVAGTGLIYIMLRYPKGVRGGWGSNGYFFIAAPECSVDDHCLLKARE